jgi:hypothetical protein
MPAVVGSPVKKNDSILKSNGNSTQSWVVVNPFAIATNRRKMFITDNNTIESIFNPLDFTQGSTSGSSDVIVLTNPSTGATLSYFFKIDVQKWRLTTNRNGPDQNDVIIANRSIIQFNRVLSGSKTITLKGTARVSIYQ